MIRLENTVTPSPEQWIAVIRGCRNPMQSYDRMDSVIEYDDWIEKENISIGENDMRLMRNLAKAGTDERKFMRMLPVIVDITAPMYWVAEHDTYKVGTTRNSCSFMHKGVARPFKLFDFSWENEDSARSLLAIVNTLNTLREAYIKTNDDEIFREIRQIMPQSYNIKYTWSANYEVLANIYFARRNHRLPEWRIFCNWILKLPYFEEIMGLEDGKNTEKANDGNDNVL